MSNFIIKYSRDERVKYISHLDFIRTFHRAVRRAGLNMAFSEGFNPHPKMTIAMPLSVGVTSDCEYMKIGFEDGYTEDEIMEKLNKSFPIGYKVLAVKEVFGKEIDFSKINRAVYEVEIECNDTDLFDQDKFMKNDSLLVMKKSKSGVKEADIRPHIYNFSATKIDKTKMKAIMCLGAGNDYNLKPDTVIDAMQKYTEGLTIDFFCSHRARVLAEDKELM